MSSIRPLITITILGLVGTILYWKIQQGPMKHLGNARVGEEAQHEADIPPLHSTASNNGSGFPSTSSSMTTPNSLAPTWTGAVTESMPLTPHNEENHSHESEPSGVSAIPEIPKIPSLPSKPDAAGQSVSSIPLPANIPEARYGSEAPAFTPPSPSTPSTNHTSIFGSVPSLGTTMPNGATPPASQLANGSSGLPSSPTAVGGTPFATAWPVIQMVLQRGDLARAHLLLSKWYGDSNLSPSEKQQVEILLGQLAGTVVYSNEHRLEPAYIVQAGDTLESIARQYNVPWQLLAKINGIAASNQIQPGDQLKVLRGPFSAVIDLTKGQLTLMLDGRYAGKFHISVQPNGMASEGSWVVEQKLVHPANSMKPSTAITPGPAPVDRELVLRGETPAAAATTLSIASHSSSLSRSSPSTQAAVQLSVQDVEELADILSVGSRVIIRR